MARIKIPYFKWRDGRPRWEPGPLLRKDGWKGRDLKNDAGDWLDFFEAQRAAMAINKELEEWRQSRSKAERIAHSEKAEGDSATIKPPASERRTVQALFDAWFASARFQRLAAKTRQDYRNKAGNFLAEFGEAPVAAVGKGHLHAFWEEAYRERGHVMANGIIAVARAALSHAVRLEWIAANPALKLELPTTPPRLVLWQPAEIECFIATAKAMGEPWVADAFIIALHSGQRRGDVLGIPDRPFPDNIIRLQQKKKKARVEIPMTPQLIERVQMIRERKRLLPVASVETLIVDRNGQPFKGDWYGKRFDLVRLEAAKSIGSILQKNFQDLRDTAVTRMADAECTIAEICSITGHQIQTAHQIMRHYLVATPGMSRSAMAKTVAYMEREGIRM